LRVCQAEPVHGKLLRSLNHKRRSRENPLILNEP